jgi:hypothetical protein
MVRDQVRKRSSRMPGYETRTYASAEDLLACGSLEPGCV